MPILFSIFVKVQSPAASPGPLNMIIDSVDTLASDLGSISRSYNFLYKVISLMRMRASMLLPPSSLNSHQSCPQRPIHADVTHLIPLTTSPPPHSDIFLPVPNPHSIPSSYPFNTLINRIFNPSSTFLTPRKILGRLHSYQ